MRYTQSDVTVIGGGPAGLATALAAANAGAQVLIIERNHWLGGILNQCIHDGFGLIRYGEQLTGPEYAQRDEALVRSHPNIRLATSSMVTEITPDREITYISKSGMCRHRSTAVVLATGCRERTRGALAIAGSRPAGIYTAGVAQELVNLRNIAVGKRVVILGSGDIGLIMARRLTLEGAEVVCVLEKLPYCSGLSRNVLQCLDDYGIPLYLNRTVTEIFGSRRLESVVASDLDSAGRPVAGSEQRIQCDTLILSVGLIPENELARMAGVKLSPVTGGAEVTSRLETSVAGIFACGNALHVNDLVDNVSREGMLAGAEAAAYALGCTASCAGAQVVCGAGVRYVMPQFLESDRPGTLSLRVTEPARDRTLLVYAGGEELCRKRLPHTTPAEMLCVEIPAVGRNASNVEVRIQ